MGRIRFAGESKRKSGLACTFEEFRGIDHSSGGEPMMRHAILACCRPGRIPASG